MILLLVWGPRFRNPQCGTKVRMGDHDQGMCAKGHKAAGQSGRCKLWEDRTLLPEGAEMSVKLIPVRNSVREEKRKKGDGEWAFFFPIGSSSILGFTGGAGGKEPACQCRRCKRCGFYPWVRKMPWSRKWQPTSVLGLENPLDKGAWGVTKGQT